MPCHPGVTVIAAVHRSEPGYTRVVKTKPSGVYNIYLIWHWYFDILIWSAKHHRCYMMYMIFCLELRTADQVVNIMCESIGHVADGSQLM